MREIGFAFCYAIGILISFYLISFVHTKYYTEDISNAPRFFILSFFWPLIWIAGIVMTILQKMYKVATTRAQK